MRILVVALLACLPLTAPPSASPASAQETGVYRTLTIRAAPGRLVELLDHLEAWRGALAEAGEEPVHVIRHSQGDHWDLLVLQPVDDLAGYFGQARRERVARALLRAGIDPVDGATPDALTAWREELFVRGPTHEVVHERFDGAGLVHVEMFEALAGKREELNRQREMENVYYRETGRPGNLIFTRLAGSPVDVYTLGFYDDLAHFARGSGMSDEAEDRAAREAGFESTSTIGTYLRELMRRHHDTLATVVR